MKIHQGFTLIEVIIYLGLFGLVMGGMVMSAYNMFELAGRTQTKTSLTAEGNFLLAKINWALIGLDPINGIVRPVLGGNASTLEIRKTDTAITNPVCITLTSGKMQIKKDGSNCSLTSGYFDLNNSSFTVTPTSTATTIFMHGGSGSGPEYVIAEFTLTTKTPNGASVSQDFSTTKYLRK